MKTINWAGLLQPHPTASSRLVKVVGVVARGGECTDPEPVKCCALDIIHQLNDLIYMVKHGMWRVIAAVVAFARVALHYDYCCCCCFRRYFHYYYCTLTEGIFLFVKYSKYIYIYSIVYIYVCMWDCAFCLCGYESDNKTTIKTTVKM